jgi:hypothetical protein
MLSVREIFGTVRGIFNGSSARGVYSRGQFGNHLVQKRVNQCV